MIAFVNEKILGQDKINIVHVCEITVDDSLVYNVLLKDDLCLFIDYNVFVFVGRFVP
jgi:hypothetical protein